MGFIDPATAYIRWGTATIPAGQTTITVTHGASFTPNKIIPNRTDLPITINNVSNTTFDLSIPEQAIDIDIEWMAGKNKNYVLMFDGVNDYVDAGNAASLNITGNLTVSMWAKITSLAASQGLMTAGATASGNTEQYALWIYNSRIEFYRGSGVATDMAYATPPIGTWVNIVAVSDGATLTIYLDGIQSGHQDPLTITPTSTMNKFLIGSLTTANFRLNGLIDEVRIWNRALSASEVTALYNGNASRDGLVLEYLFQEASGTTATDTSGSGNQGTISGATYLETEVE